MPSRGEVSAFSVKIQKESRTRFMPFEKLRLIEPLLRAVRSEGYTIPTAIQTQAIPHVLEGRDLMGCAQTGTGKTAAFALPILQRLHQRLGAGAPAHSQDHAQSQVHGHGHGQAQAHAHGHGRATHPHDRPAGGRYIRALVITPTRELAAQIAESFRVYGRHVGLRHTVIFGGVKQGSQVQALRQGVDILVATPGRLLDLLNQRMLTLKNIEIFVLDEADRMLDMGFIHDIRRVIAQLPAKRQTLMFSATMPKEIRGLADTLLDRPVEVRIAAESPAADTVNQVLYFVEPDCKIPLLEYLLTGDLITRALVFTRTKHGADKVARRLIHAEISAEAIHSNKSQNARIRALDNFKRGKTRVLVASDIASRGLDVDDISHVINFDLPNEPETYVHRIGRTGRAGAQGQAISFCSREQRDLLRDIEKLLGNRVPVLDHSIKAPPPVPGEPRRQHQGGTSHQHHAHVPGRHQAGHQAVATSHKSASPEQQQTAFWNRRRKSGRRMITGRPRRFR